MLFQIILLALLASPLPAPIGTLELYPAFKITLLSEHVSYRLPQPIGASVSAKRKPAIADGLESGGGFNPQDTSSQSPVRRSLKRNQRYVASADPTAPAEVESSKQQRRGSSVAERRVASDCTWMSLVQVQPTSLSVPRPLPPPLPDVPDCEDE